MPRLRAIALTCITAKNREQVGVIEFWGAQQPMVRCVSFFAPKSESGRCRTGDLFTHPKLNPIRPITLDNGAHTRDIDIAILFVSSGKHVHTLGNHGLVVEYLPANTNTDHDAEELHEHYGHT